MALQDIDIARRAFTMPEWGETVRAILSATESTLSVFDFAAGEMLAGGASCRYCFLATGEDCMGSGTCFDSFPGAPAGSGRFICRAGLPALYAPVMCGERTVAHAVLSGFVTSTRERRGRYEHLLARGVAEESARRAVKSIPIMSRTQAEAYLQMGCTTASTIFAVTLERTVAAEKVEELKLFVTAGHQAMSASQTDAATLENMTAEAMAMAGASACALLRPCGDSLEVLATTSEWRGETGATVSLDTVAGRAVANRRAVSAPALPDGSVTVGVPLLLPERVAGVFELRMPPGSALGGERLTRLARFAQFVAVALERDAERVAVQRAMAGYTQLNALASSLGAQTDVAGVSESLVHEMGAAFDFTLAGVVLHSWGADRADLAADRELDSHDIAHVLELVTGRDLEASPIAHVRVVSGATAPAPRIAEKEWSLSAVAIGHGELDVGWMFVARCDAKSYSAQDRALLEAFAAHGGPAFARAALFARIRDDYASTIEALFSTLGAREHVHATRVGNVMEYAVRIGEKLGLGVDAVERLRFAGLLHDTGKAGIPGEITLRPTALTPQELLEVHSRADVSPSIVDQIEFLESLTPVILHHHENWDGSGYPHGLAGEQIPQLARVLRVAEAFAELIDPGEAKLTAQKACAQLQAAAGTLYEAAVVKALSGVIRDQEKAGATGLLAPGAVSHSETCGIEESSHRC